MIFSQKLVGRYDELKQKVLDCILLMQVGTFMQVMNEDARAVSQVTGLKLRMAGEVDAPVVLGGFPKSGLDAYVGKLVRAGHSVAIGWELWGSYPEDLLPKGWQRFHESRLAIVRSVLWESGLPVAWIGETGRRVTAINERALVRRWPGVSDQRPLSSLFVSTV